MNEKRCRAGICSDQFGKKRIYIGGGRSSPSRQNAIRLFEYYDVTKNLWNELSDTRVAKFGQMTQKFYCSVI